MSGLSRWRSLVRMVVVVVVVVCLLCANGVRHRPVCVGWCVLRRRCCGLRLLLEVVLPIVLLPIRVHVGDQEDGWQRGAERASSSKTAVGEESG